jgi:hypothetical protein
MKEKLIKIKLILAGLSHDRKMEQGVMEVEEWQNYAKDTNCLQQAEILIDTVLGRIKN